MIVIIPRRCRTFTTVKHKIESLDFIYATLIVNLYIPPFVRFSHAHLYIIARGLIYWILRLGGSGNCIKIRMDYFHSSGATSVKRLNEKKKLVIRIINANGRIYSLRKRKVIFLFILGMICRQDRLSTRETKFSLLSNHLLA